MRERQTVRWFVELGKTPEQEVTGSVRRLNSSLYVQAIPVQRAVAALG